MTSELGRIYTLERILKGEMAGHDGLEYCI